MDVENVFDDAEGFLRAAARDLLSPRAGECLVCFVARQLQDFGCDGSQRFTRMFRDRAAPRATALFARLARMGARCCDCEIFLNAYALGRPQGAGGPAWELFEDGDPPDLPPCHGVRRGSTQACGVWEPMGFDW